MIRALFSCGFELLSRVAFFELKDFQCSLGESASHKFCLFAQNLYFDLMFVNAHFAGLNL